MKNRCHFDERQLLMLFRKADKEKSRRYTLTERANASVDAHFPRETWNLPEIVYEFRPGSPSEVSKSLG